MNSARPLEHWEGLPRKIHRRMASDAKRRWLDFTLTESEVWRLVTQPCTYCGAHGSKRIEHKGKVHHYNGLDRKNPKRGYTADNVATSCSFCNSLRGSISWADWTDFVSCVVTSHDGRDPFPLETPSDGRETRTYYRRK